jgi:spoIIIJ-associated protein
MKYFIEAQNVEELRRALEELDLNIDEVDYKEAEPETARLFGREKGYVITEKAPERAARFTRRLLYMMGFKAKVKVTEFKDSLEIEIEGEDLKVLIGKQGKTLEAFQAILNAALNHKAIEKKVVYIDINGYRKKRREQIKRLVENAVKMAIETGKKVELEPMVGFERKIVHEIVSGIPGLKTESVGEEPQRYVVIIPEKT